MIHAKVHMSVAWGSDIAATTDRSVVRTDSTVAGNDGTSWRLAEVRGIVTSALCASRFDPSWAHILSRPTRRSPVSSPWTPPLLGRPCSIPSWWYDRCGTLTFHRESVDDRWPRHSPRRFFLLWARIASTHSVARGFLLRLFAGMKPQ